jgi:hypothetical protein
MSNSQLELGFQMPPPNQLTSPDGNTVLSMQTNGVPVLFVNGQPVWQINAATNPPPSGYTLVFGEDGNLCITNLGGNSLWCSGTFQPNATSGSVNVLDSGQMTIVVNGATVAIYPQTPDVGNEMQIEIVNDATGQVVYAETYEYAEGDAEANAPAAAEANASAPTKATRSVGGGNWKLKSQNWVDESLKPEAVDDVSKRSVSGAANAAGGGAAAAAGVVLEVSKFAWESIKDNKPVVALAGASTYVLNQTDTNPMDYQSAQNGQSGTFTYRGIIWPTNYTQFEIKVCLSGSYKATPVPSSPPAPGTYLPSVYVAVPTCTVYWPCSANASATVNPPVNVGTGTVDAQVDILASIQVGDFIENFNKTLKFTATGSKGFKLVSLG